MVISRILIDKRSNSDPMTERITGLLPDATTSMVDPLQPPYTGIESGAGTLILTHHPGAFVKDFPMTPGAPPCGEKYIITLQGCPFHCSYCYLQSYLEHRQMIIFTNTRRMKEEVSRAILDESPSRITTGEFGDSLALDHLTGLTLDLLPLFHGTSTVLEARTKSDATTHIIESAEKDPSSVDNLVLTWTLAPEPSLRGEEFGAASLPERISALSGATRVGIRTAVRLDPVVPHWYDREGYHQLIGELKRSGAVPERFELGILRFPPGLWEAVREKDQASALLKGEYFTDREGKKRYYRPGRIRIYREIAASVREYYPDAVIELSMEDRESWEDAGIEFIS